MFLGYLTYTCIVKCALTELWNKLTVPSFGPLFSWWPKGDLKLDCEKMLRHELTYPTRLTFSASEPVFTYVVLL